MISGDKYLVEISRDHLQRPTKTIFVSTSLATGLQTLSVPCLPDKHDDYQNLEIFLQK